MKTTERRKRIFPPVGYKSFDRVLLPNQKEAKIVRRIFEIGNVSHETDSVIEVLKLIDRH